MADVIRNRVQRDRSILRVLRTSLVMLLTLRLRGNAFFFAFSTSRAFVTGPQVANLGSKCWDTLGLLSHSLNHRITKFTESIRLDTCKEKNFS